jgi:hypothetical protein
VEHEKRDRSDRHNCDQPPADERDRPSPTGRHAQQNDHGHHRDRTRERDGQPERRNFGD